MKCFVALLLLNISIYSLTFSAFICEARSGSLTLVKSVFRNSKECLSHPKYSHSKVCEIVTKNLKSSLKKEFQIVGFDSSNLKKIEYRSPVRKCK